MKLTDLSIDCLEIVLENLESDDRLNAADSNMRLRKAASFIFVREHRTSNSDNIEFDLEIVDTTAKLKTSLQNLRCFGHLMTELYFEASSEGLNFDQLVINCISEYCSNTLKCITIVHDLEKWEYLQKPFLTVEEVNLDGFHDANNKIFNRLFPKMRKLSTNFNGNRKSFLGISNYFPNLTELRILGENLVNFSTLNAAIISPILRLNPQINILCIFDDIQTMLNCRIFKNTLKNLKNLQEFSFDIKQLPTESIDTVIRLTNVHTVEIHVTCTRMLKIPFFFGQLKKLTISFYGLINAEVMDKLLQFIDEHPTVRILILMLRPINSNIYHYLLPKMAKLLPMLDSIAFDLCEMSVDDAIYAFSVWQNLKHFTCKLNANSEYYDFQACLSQEWEYNRDFQEGEFIKIHATRIGPMEKKTKIH